jgi:hypothetical protein
MTFQAPSQLTSDNRQVPATVAHSRYTSMIKRSMSTVKRPLASTQGTLT